MFGHLLWLRVSFLPSALALWQSDRPSLRSFTSSITAADKSPGKDCVLSTSAVQKVWETEWRRESERCGGGRVSERKAAGNNQKGIIKSPSSPTALKIPRKYHPKANVSMLSTVRIWGGLPPGSSSLCTLVCKRYLRLLISQVYPDGQCVRPRHKST